jgi:hypothetical protein
MRRKHWFTFKSFVCGQQHFIMKDPGYLKVIMRIKTTASNPDVDSSSSSESFHALLTQPGEGISLSRLKRLLRLEVPSSSKRGI